MNLRGEGFTIIESIVTIVVLAIIAYSVTLIVIEGFKVWFENKDYIELRADGRYALKRMAGEFRQADAGSYSMFFGTFFTFNVDADNNGSQELVMYTQDTDDMTLLLRELPDEGSSAVICGNVNSILFNCQPPLLTITFVLSKNGHNVTLRTTTAARCGT